MEKGSKNKMVTGKTKNVRNKDLQTYYFPSLGISVEAESAEEAEKKAKESKK